jgi:hypothetical protein
MDPSQYVTKISDSDEKLAVERFFDDPKNKISKTLLVCKTEFVIRSKLNRLLSLVRKDAQQCTTIEARRASKVF